MHPFCFETMRKNSAANVLFVLLALALLLALFGCDSTDSSVGEDGDGADAESSDDALPVCEPEALRCHSENPRQVEICRTDGSGWRHFRDCPQDKICEANVCVAEDGDLDDPIPTDGDGSDGDTDLMEIDPDADGDGTDVPDKRCETACAKGRACGFEEQELWWLYQFCRPECDFGNFDTELTACLDRESCVSFHACVSALWRPDQYASDCIEKCSKLDTCRLTLDGIWDLDEHPCNWSCDWMGVDERVAGCAEQYSDCDGFGACLDSYREVDGDEVEQELDCYDGEAPDYSGPASVSNCWNDTSMIPIDGRYCIDRYEAVVTANGDCTGTRYGIDEYDFPEGFPRCVNCYADGYCDDDGLLDCFDEDWTTEQTTPLYACSLPGVRPSRFISWYQAMRACKNVGKRLCSLEEWTFACNGGTDRPVPYGSAPLASACYTDEGDDFGTGESGGRCHCASPEGVFDLIGNLKEWLSDEVEIGKYQLIGAAWWINYDSTSATCLPESVSSIHPHGTMKDLGFRCCRSE